MTKECTLKELFVMGKLDELQPDWRTGADVTKETKEKIRQRVFEKYGEFLENASCISIRSIEATVTRIRKKQGVEAKSKKTSLAETTHIRATSELAPEPEKETEQELTEQSYKVIPNEPPQEEKEEHHHEQCIVEEKIIPDSDMPGQIPMKNVAVICPGCGYGYYHGKWYSPEKMENKYV